MTRALAAEFAQKQEQLDAQVSGITGMQQEMQATKNAMEVILSRSDEAIRQQGMQGTQWKSDIEKSVETLQSQTTIEMRAALARTSECETRLATLSELAQSGMNSNGGNGGACEGAFSNVFREG